MESKLTKINTMYLTLSGLKDIYLINERNLYDYKRIGLIIGTDRINVSQIMYGIRKKIIGGKSILVDKDSYVHDKCKVIDAIIEYTLIRSESKTDSTIFTDLRLFIVFTDWADKENINYYRSIEDARKAYELYSYFKRSTYRKGIISQRTAHGHQKAAKILLSEIFNDKEGVISVNISSISSGNRNKSSIANQENVNYSFNFYYNIFDQITDFLLNKIDYPFELNLPNENLWVIPSIKRWVYPSHWKNIGIPNAFDFKNGVILNYDETLKKSNYKTEKSKWSILKKRKIFIENLEKSNLDYKNEIRLALGSRAIKAYFMVMAILTGMNDSVLATLSWNDSDDFDEEVLEKGFRNIKKRANHKIVEFNIQKTFINSFKKFLKLRRYVLNGNKIDKLFFIGYGKNVQVSATQGKGTFASNIYNSVFMKIDPKLTNTLTREFRVTKARWIREKKGQWVSSILMQSSPIVIDNHYHGESEEEQKNQLSIFFEKLHDKIIDSEDKYDDIVAGKCSDIENPSQEEGLKIKSDCKTPEGCLFCKKYRLHNSENDIRKLFSLEYVIREFTLPNAKYMTHFFNIMEPVLNRINDFIDALIKKYPESSDLVNNTKIDVFENENLTYYWENKLQTLFNIGYIK